MIAAYLSKIENSPPDELEFNIGGISFFPPAEIEQEQMGYEGDDWNKSWLVIARDISCGDPIFIDTSNPYFPVLTAVHGVGHWEPMLVAESLSIFIQAIETLRPHTVGREHPVGLSENPILASERQAIYLGLRDLVGDTAPVFLDNLLFCD